jgi:hypothetical protein
MPVQQGQLYLVNTFDLGFINILPADILIEVKVADACANLLELAPLPLPDGEVCDSFRRIVRWFEEDYPGRSKENCILKNVSAFETLISRKIAVPAGRERLLEISVNS